MPRCDEPRDDHLNLLNDEQANYGVEYRTWLEVSPVKKVDDVKIREC